MLGPAVPLQDPLRSGPGGASASAGVDLEALEAENDRSIAALGERVGALRGITTGIHGLHVFIGLLAMVLLLGRMRGKQGGDPGELAAFQGVSYYWHFVDVVWVGLYACLFLLK